MLNELKQNKLNEVLLLGGMTLLCLCLSIFRMLYTQTSAFLFLNWNLFLAFIPWILTSFSVNSQLRQSKVSFFVVLFIWLLFFPNAPYILTDLFHLNLRSPMPMWYDLILILTYAWTGLLFGYFSLWYIENMMSVFVKQVYIPIISVTLLFISSFGIYIGRFLRWNSWDVVTKPYGLIGDITARFVNPVSHTKTWGVTLFMGLFLTAIYFSFRYIKNLNKEL